LRRYAQACNCLVKHSRDHSEALFDSNASPRFSSADQLHAGESGKQSALTVKQHPNESAAAQSRQQRAGCCDQRPKGRDR